MTSYKNSQYIDLFDLERCASIFDDNNCTYAQPVRRFTPSRNDQSFSLNASVPVSFHLSKHEPDRLWSIARDSKLRMVRIF